MTPSDRIAAAMSAILTAPSLSAVRATKQAVMPALIAARAEFAKECKV